MRQMEGHGEKKSCTKAAGAANGCIIGFAENNRMLRGYNAALSCLCAVLAAMESAIFPWSAKQSDCVFVPFSLFWPIRIAPSLRLAAKQA